jgi:hypothetical protein
LPALAPVWVVWMGAACGEAWCAEDAYQGLVCLGGVAYEAAGLAHCGGVVSQGGVVWCGGDLHATVWEGEWTWVAWDGVTWQWELGDVVASRGSWRHGTCIAMAW